jgi:hypothetical protein
MNIHLKSTKKFKQNLNKYIDIIYSKEDNNLLFKDNHSLLTSKEIEKSCKKYIKNDPSPSVWTTFFSLLPTSIILELQDHMRLTFLSNLKPLDTPIEIFETDDATRYFWNDVWYFDRNKMAFYNLSRVKSFDISEEKGYTELRLSNGDINSSLTKASKNYISIKGKNNMLNICRALKRLENPIADDVCCLIECMDVVGEFDWLHSVPLRFNTTNLKEV